MGEHDQRILRNAVAAIQVGVEDYQSQDERRLLSAIRNIYAGILLLAKAHLARLSPPGTNEALIKSKIRLAKQADGSLKVVGLGKKTVTAEQIKERFKDLGISFDWSPLASLQEIRNNVEHYYFRGSRQHVLEAMHDAHSLVHGLVTGVLREDPLQLLEARCWDVLLTQSNIFESEARVCRESMRDVEWSTARAGEAAEYLRCPTCSTRLVRQAGGPARDQMQLVLQCAACGETFDYKESLVATLNWMFYAETHFGVLDGQGAPLEICPDCHESTYIIEDKQCAFCAYSMPEDAACAICHQLLSVAEYGANPILCEYHVLIG